jgi:hypothetical protein
MVTWSARPALRPVQHAEDDDRGRLDAVDHYVGGAHDDELAGAGDSSRPRHRRVVRKAPDRSVDGITHVQGCPRVVLSGPLELRLEAADSLG